MRHRKYSVSVMLLLMLKVGLNIPISWKPLKLFLWHQQIIKLSSQTLCLFFCYKSSTLFSFNLQNEPVKECRRMFHKITRTFLTDHLFFWSLHYTNFKLRQIVCHRIHFFEMFICYFRNKNASKRDLTSPFNLYYKQLILFILNSK